VAESTYKCGRRKGFTTVYRSVAQDSRLSLKARGLFLLLQSLPEDWNYTISGLAGLAGVGRDQIRSGLEELQEVGYLVKEQAHNEAGKFSGNVFVLQEEPPPLSGNPATVFPTTGNPTEQNNNLNTPLYPPKGGRRERKKREPRKAPDWKPERFEKFWQFYPEKGRKDKQAAMDEWDKLQPDDALLAEIAAGLQKLMATDEWKRGVGIPYVCRFLRKERWKDAESLGVSESDQGEQRRYVGTKIVDGEEVDIYE